jgi:hypothetical protein
MLMGQAEENEIKITGEKVKFVEDLTPEERAKLLKEKQGVIWKMGGCQEAIDRAACWSSEHGQYLLPELIHPMPAPSERTEEFPP